MKKFAVVIVILLLVFCCFSSLAEAFDLNDMTTDELVELQIQIQDELYKRDRFMDCFVISGEYIVGDELKAGSYIIHCVDTFGVGDKCRIASIDIETGEVMQSVLRFEKDNLYKMDLIEGQKFVLIDGVVEFLPFN